MPLCGRHPCRSICIPTQFLSTRVSSGQRQNTMPSVARGRKGSLRPREQQRGPCHRAHCGRRIFSAAAPCRRGCGVGAVRAVPAARSRRAFRRFPAAVGGFGSLFFFGGVYVWFRFCSRFSSCCRCCCPSACRWLGLVPSGLACGRGLVPGAGLRVCAVSLLGFCCRSRSRAVGVWAPGLGAVRFCRFAGVRGVRLAGSGFCRQGGGPCRSSVRLAGVVCPVGLFGWGGGSRAGSPSCRFFGLCFVMGRGVVAVAGSRSLPRSFAPLVQGVVASVVGSGRSAAVGCCVGADAFALSSGVAASAVRCFAAFGPGGVGACSLSAVSAVSAFAAAGGCVAWWAGGPASVPLRSRLAARTQAVIGTASVSAVVFFASPSSRGSLLACRLAAARGLPVFAFPCGFAGSALPSLGAGAWVPVGGSGVWSAAFRWASGQAAVF